MISTLPVLMFFSPANTWKRHWTKALDLKGDKAPMQLRELYQVHLGVRDGALFRSDGMHWGCGHRPLIV